MKQNSLNTGSIPIMRKFMRSFTALALALPLFAAGVLVVIRALMRPPLGSATAP